KIKKNREGSSGNIMFYPCSGFTVVILLSLLRLLVQAVEPKLYRPFCYSQVGGIKMTTVPGQLVWEIVKKNNSFLVKEFGNGTAGLVFSKEPNNLYNLHSYKHSGLANKKTATIQPGGKGQSVLLATSKTKKQNKPSSLLNKSVMKKEFRRIAKAVSNQVADNYYRPDLKKASLARLSAVNKSLKVAKSGVKKRNRQA
ncbi:hypothetical protein AABB24_031472, partial [Solanum stoloniferum]